MPLFVYGFRDSKSGVVSNLFVTSEPFEKVKQNISISLLQLSLKDQTNPYVLYASDYDLVLVGVHPDEMKDVPLDHSVNCSVLLAASRKAFNAGKVQTSPDDQLDKLEE